MTDDKLTKLSNIVQQLYSSLNPQANTQPQAQGLQQQGRSRMQPYSQHSQEDEKVVAPELAGNNSRDTNSDKPVQIEDMPFQKCMPDILEEESHDKNVFGKIANRVTYLHVLKGKINHGKQHNSR